jgi:rubrerythrin
MTDQNENAENGEAVGHFERLTGDLGGAFGSRRDFLKKGAAASAVGLGLSTGAGNVAASGDVSDDDLIETLNYAITLERLEATFYEEGLSKFSEDDLRNSELIQRFGDPVQSTLHEQLTMIRDHERAHVEALVKTVEKLEGDPLGADEVAFNFPLESPSGFIETAQTLETTGVSAYAGVAPSIQNDQILAAALSIHSVEGRHSAYLNGLTGKSPFPRAFDEPLDPETVRERIAPFIASN